MSPDDWAEVDRIRRKKNKTYHEQIIVGLYNSSNHYRRQVTYAGEILGAYHEHVIKQLEDARGWNSFVARAVKNGRKAL